MGFSLAHAILIPLLLAIPQPISATPTIAFPINAQVPPVARVQQPYSFTFAPTTFTTNDDDTSNSITYGLTSPAPSWLSLDSTTRTLFGTPDAANLGSAVFSLTATDVTGTVAMQVTLVVVDLSTPAATDNMTAQLAQAGPLAGLSSVSLYTGTEFALSFIADEMFTPLVGAVYYATCGDRAPLPSWASFSVDATGGMLRFTGTTPPLLSGPQTFTFLVIASRVVGFAEAEVGFALEVGGNRLVFEPLEQTVDLEVGKAVDFTSLQRQLLFDGQPITQKGIIEASAQVPDWLHFDTITLALSGQPPAESSSQEVNVTVTDIHGDNATAIVNFRFQSTSNTTVTSPVFTGDIGVLDVTTGKHFTYNIKDLIVLNSQNIVASVEFATPQSWLYFDSTTLTLYGDVPSTATSSIIKATFVVNSTSSTASEAQAFEIQVTQPGVPTSAVASKSAPASSGATQSSTSSATHSPGMSGISELGTGTWVGIGVISGIALLVLVSSIMWLCRKKRQQNKSWFPKPKSPHSRGGKKPWISKPVPGPKFWHMHHSYNGHSPRSTDYQHDLEKGDSEERTLDQPPQIESDIVGVGHSIRSSKYRQSDASFLLPHDEDALKEMNRTSLGLDALGIHVPHDSMKIPAQIARGLSETSYSKRRSCRSSGLPVDKTVIGLGHGRSSHGSPTRRPGSLMRRRTRETLSWMSNGSLSMKRQIDSFLSQPRESEVTSDSHHTNAHKVWIRVVSPEAQPPLDVFEERRRSYIRRRASSTHTNSLFAARTGLSRESSYGKRTPFGKASHNSRRLVQSTTFTRSKSSSVGIQRTTEWPRARESTRSTFKSEEGWESGSNYSDDESEDEAAHDETVQVEEEREDKRSKWSHRLGRDGRGEIMDSITERDASGSIEQNGGLAQAQRSWTRQALSPPPLVLRQRLASAATDTSGDAAFL